MASAVMGSVGSSLGSLAGGTFGWSAATWSQIGWTAGVLAANYIFAPEGPEIRSEGARLEDLRVTSSAYGLDIPKVYGSYRISGNIIWALPLSETRHEERQEEGKGGGGSSSVSIWYTYKGTWAMALCDGPITDIKKIWFGSKLVYNNGDFAAPLEAGKLTKYLGTSSQSIDAHIQANKPDTPAFRHLAYLVFSGIELEDLANAIPNVTVEVQKGTDYVSTIVSELILESGLEASDFDVTAGVDEVQGYTIPRNANIRPSIDILLSAYEYILVESDHKMQLRKEEQDPILTIDEDDLGADTENGIETNHKQAIDSTKSLTIRYANKDSDYQTSAQMAMSSNTNLRNELVKEVPLVLTDSEAKALAEKTLYKSYISRFTYKFDLPFLAKYLTLVCGDVVTLEFYGYLKDVRIVGISTSDAGIITMEAIELHSSTFTSSAIAQDTGVNSSELKEPPGPTDFEVLDIPTLSNDYINNEGVYLIASGESEGWTGASVFSKSSGVDDFAANNTLTGKTGLGLSIDVLQDASTHVWDRDNSVTVTSSVELLYVSEVDLLAGKNYCLLGSEVFQYSESIDNGDGSYTLSNLLRGRRGTESHTSDHSIDERFVYFNNLSTGFASSTINSDSSYTALTVGETTFEEVKTVKNTGNNLKPFSVSYLRSLRNSDDSIDLIWMRRSRYISGYFKTLPKVDVPETYNIEVYSSGILSGGYITNSPSFTYDATKASNDGVILDSEIAFIIYHYSGLYGNGYSKQIIVQPA